MSRLLFLIFLHMFCLSNPASAQQSAQNPTPQDVKDIEQVMDAFHAAVVAHEGAKLATLFVPEGSAWFNVLTDSAYAGAKTKSDHAAKVRLSSFQNFATFVSTTKDRLDPRHAQIQIHSDGTIASVYFDFVFMINDKPENSGCETWQLVKTAEGWKIAAIAYSSVTVH